MSEPKQPIVFWIDRNIPEKYRATVVAGVLEWNKAFEKIGFKNAIEAKIQPDDARLRHARRAPRVDPLDDVTARPTFGGIGPSQVDPRTGEILDADIGIDPVLLRNRRFMRVEQIPDPAALRGFTKHAEFCARSRTTRRRSRASRSTCWRRAATSSPTAPRRSSSRSTR